MRKSKKCRLLWAAAAIWTAALFYLAAQNGTDSGALSGRVMGVVLRIFPWLADHTDVLHTVIRKLAHLGGFMLDGILIAAAMRSTTRRSGFVWIAAPVCAALAAANEITQLFAGGRSCEIRDMLIDFSGALLGICMVWWFTHRKVD